LDLPNLCKPFTEPIGLRTYGNCTSLEKCMFRLCPRKMVAKFFYLVRELWFHVLQIHHLRILTGANVERSGHDTLWIMFDQISLQCFIFVQFSI